MVDPLGTLDPGSTLREVQDVYERTQTPSNGLPSESSSSDQSTQTPQHNPSSGSSDCGSTRSTSTVVPALDRRRRTPPSRGRTLERSPPSYGTIPSGGGNFEAGGVPVSPTHLEAGYDGAQESVERLIYNADGSANATPARDDDDDGEEDEEEEDECWCTWRRLAVSLILCMVVLVAFFVWLIWCVAEN